MKSIVFLLVLIGTMYAQNRTSYAVAGQNRQRSVTRTQEWVTFKSGDSSVTSKKVAHYSVNVDSEFSNIEIESVLNTGEDCIHRDWLATQISLFIFLNPLSFAQILKRESVILSKRDSVTSITYVSGVHSGFSEVEFLSALCIFLVFFSSVALARNKTLVSFFEFKKRDIPFLLVILIPTFMSVFSMKFFNIDNSPLLSFFVTIFLFLSVMSLNFVFYKKISYSDTVGFCKNLLIFLPMGPFLFLAGILCFLIYPVFLILITGPIQGLIITLILSLAGTATAFGFTPNIRKLTYQTSCSAVSD